MSVVIAVSPPSSCSSLIFGTDGWSYGDRTAHINVWLHGMLGAHRVPVLTSFTPAPGDTGGNQELQLVCPGVPLGTYRRSKADISNTLSADLP